jgi:broad specificity phosphatase PhoE
MGVIYLVRHGQASFGADDYDKLSSFGHEQARVLGAALKARVSNPDRRLARVLSGSMRRHRETARGCLDALGCEVPVDIDARWNEFDHEELLLKHEPAFSDKARLYAELATAADPTTAFETLFRGAVARWVGGSFDHEYTESWPAFRRRCEAALDTLVESLGPSKTALVFTSGGPISSLVQRDFELTDARALQLPVALANCGMTKMIYGARGTRLSTLNEHGWFEGAERRLLTYR